MDFSEKMGRALARNSGKGVGECKYPFFKTENQLINLSLTLSDFFLANSRGDIFNTVWIRVVL